VLFRSEIEAFKPQEYWSVEADFTTADGGKLTARLSVLDGRKLDRLDIKSKAEADRAVAAIMAAQHRVLRVEKKTVKRHPSTPFTTSTLQQEASRKLGFSATHTMRVAQRLYEGVDIGGETVGLISYMRTDGVNLSQEAIAGCRKLIQQDYGRDYLPEQPRVYRSAAKNAQEAHEAIRPTDLARRPKDVEGDLDRDQLRLYDLIWKRTLASQMESASLDQTTVDIGPQPGRLELRATGSVIVFDGFLRLYHEDRDDPTDDDEDSRLLPRVAPEDPLNRGDVRADQHFTQPPPRYSEASLVKKLEELGIGRPSTYASILQVLQDRLYVKLEKRRFIPEDRGRLVTSFLSNFFERYVQYNFTAELEEQLDEISGGRIDWKTVLRDFWTGFSQAIDGTKDLTVKQVLEALDQSLGQHFFPELEGGTDPRRCPSCAAGRLGLKLGRHGAFIGCSNYPECRYTRPLAVAGENGDGTMEADDFPRALGTNPATGEPVSLRKGPYGLYVQEGEALPPPPKEPGKKRKKADAGPKPKRASLPRGMAPDDVDLDKALKLLALPREVGVHPDSGEMIVAGIGRFGPYLKHGPSYKSLPAGDDVLIVGLNRAVDLLAQPSNRPARVAARVLGADPADGKPVAVGTGRYGPYVRHGSVFANVPKGTSVDEVTLEQAVAWLAERRAAGGGAKTKSAPKARAPKAKAEAPSAKTATGKTATGKTATGKTATKAAGRTAPKAAAKAPKGRKAPPAAD
jgi:DNA topoisomerase-1